MWHSIGIEQICTIITVEVSSAFEKDSLPKGNVVYGQQP